MTAAALRVALVAGELSGDILGGRVMAALRSAFPDHQLSFEGVGGEQMRAQGLHSLYPMERLAVMGLVEPLARLPELLRMRADLARRFCENPPDLFLGIDAPDFNLALARKLKAAGVGTAHLVSPTVWAWRPGRVNTVARSVDRILCLFPFEPPLYAGTGVEAHFVGHPMISELSGVPDRAAARRALGVDPDAPVIALLPGSRQGEVSLIAEPLLSAAALLRERDPRRVFLLPAANAERYSQCAAIIAEHRSAAAITLLEGQSRLAMLAADVVMLSSGTATLEAMLLQRPMVIAYRAAQLNWSIMSRLVVTPWVGLPNVLAGREVVPELLQDRLSAPALALEAEALLYDPSEQLSEFARQTQALSIDFDSAVAGALAPLIRHAS